jgi:cell division protein FtsB
MVYSKISIGVLLVLITLLSKGVYGVYAKALESDKNKYMAQMEYDELAEREAVIVAQIGQLKTDDGLEKEIREKFNVAREGEQMLVLLEEEKKKEKYTEVEENPSLWSKVKNFFTR